MTDLHAEAVFAGIPIADRDASVAWYERVLGREPDLIPNAIEAAWRLTDTGWIYVIVDPERAGTALNTVLVADLHALVADLERRGARPTPIHTMPGAALTSTITDPDGNRIQFGQPI
jgi:predicted enzyme related to lactoylglutathione lyase